MSAHVEKIDLPDAITVFLSETVAQKMRIGKRDPAAALDRLPGSMPVGEVLRLCEGGPFGWLLDARAYRIDERIALEVCEHPDGRHEPLPRLRRRQRRAPARRGVRHRLSRRGSEDEEKRIEQEYFERNRAVHALLAERGFK